MTSGRFTRRKWRCDPLILSQLACGANSEEIVDFEERNGPLHGTNQNSAAVGFEPSSIASQFGGDVMNKKLLKEKWSYITLFSFSKSFCEPCISEMIYLFYIFWDRRINVIFVCLLRLAQRCSSPKDRVGRGPPGPADDGPEGRAAAGVPAVSRGARWRALLL